MASKHSLDSSENETKKVKTGHWSQGLKSSMEDPNLIVESDERLVIIKDKYPKAKHHYLILPKENIPNLKALKKEHLSLLKHMDEKAKEMVAKFDSNVNFRIGYHAVPSMSHLHLHVISQDFDSPCLKTKLIGIHSQQNILLTQKLETAGSIKTMDPAAAKEMLKNPLRCHICKEELSTIPKLKTHIAKCVK